MLILKRLTVWLLEVACEAVGTSLILIILVFTLQASGQPGKIRLDAALKLATTTPSVILAMFILSGYVFTTALAACTLRGRGRWVYPGTAAALFIIHSTIVRFVIPTGLSLPELLTVQVAGSCFTFICAYLGNGLMRRWAGRL